MFKKFSFSYLILFAIVLFTATENCYAATRYWFNYDLTLVQGLCDASDSPGCKIKCKDGSSGGNASSTSIYGNCEGYEDISKFSYLTTYNKVSDFRNDLMRFQCGKVNCYEYVAKTYCNNFKKNETVCTALKAVKKEGNVTTDGRYCNVSLKLLNNDGSLKSNTEKKLIIYIPSENSKNSFTVGPSGADSEINFSVPNQEATLLNNKFYFYAKYSDFATFEKDYISAAGGVSGTKCPAVTFCLDRVDKKNWYAEMSGTCDSSKYFSGESQTSGSDGINEGLTLREDEPHPGQNLINGNKISILDCKTLLGGDGTNTSLVDLLKTGLNVIKIIVPIILIVLGSLDFAQAVFASNEDAIKKAQSKFVKRLIIAAVIFLIPSVLKVILQLANSIWGNIDPDFCGILD